LGLYYRSIYRAIRKVYKWSPDVVDKLSINRLLTIFEEIEEDAPKQEIDEDDLM
jgi:hypothetical protein